MAEPVIIVDYDPEWAFRYAAEQASIVAVLGDLLVALEHVGSTAVPGLGAKPIVDIMAGVRTLEDGERCVPFLKELGYEFHGFNGIPGRLYFNKGRPRSIHLHMVAYASEFWRRHLAFRDCLRAHPAAARQYEALKRELAARYREDREGYTEAKTPFIERILARCLPTSSPRQ